MNFELFCSDRFMQIRKVKLPAEYSTAKTALLAHLQFSFLSKHRGLVTLVKTWK